MNRHWMNSAEFIQPVNHVHSAGSNSVDHKLLCRLELLVTARPTLMLIPAQSWCKAKSTPIAAHALLVAGVARRTEVNREGTQVSQGVGATTIKIRAGLKRVRRIATGKRRKVSRGDRAVRRQIEATDVD